MIAVMILVIVIVTIVGLCLLNSLMNRQRCRRLGKLLCKSCQSVIGELAISKAIKQSHESVVQIMTASDLTSASQVSEPTWVICGKCGNKEALGELVARNTRI